LPHSRVYSGDEREVRNRSVIELMVLVLTFVVGITILGAGATIAFIEVRDPESDSSVAANVLINIVSTILGALLGLLAGRSRFTEELSHHPDEDEEDE
jgi:cytochrome c biogenesis protein CcdA